MPPRASEPLTRALTFAVLADGLAGEYQSAVVGGVVEAARESGVNLVIIDGCLLRAPLPFGERHRAVYDLARSEGIDGLVIQAGSFVNYLGLDDLARYCEHYRPRPMVSLAAAVEGTTGILVDGEQALREGIRHLVEDHQYRHFAFLGGPEANLEARDRLGTCGDVLAAYGLSPPDLAVVTGDFRYESGVDAVRVLLDERGAVFDAMVAANDLMALGAIDALRARDIKMPGDVAIIGFDDIGEARYCDPPLTTIRQPLRQQGRLAVEILLRRLRGERVDDVLVLPAELVVRRSCGCSSDEGRVSTTGNQPAPLTPTETEFTVDDALRLRRPKILEAMREAVGGLADALPAGWEEGLFDALAAELRDSPRAFAERLTMLLKEMMRPGVTADHWQPALSALHRELMPCLAANPSMGLRVEDLLEEARVLVDEAVDAQAHHRLILERRTQSLSEAAETLSAAFDLESLGEALRECLPRLGVTNAFLVLDDDVPPSGARVVFAQDPAFDPSALEDPRDATVEGTSIPDGLLPADRTYAMVVEPLFFKDDPLGYAVFEMGPTDAFIYDALRVRISGVLKVALLIEELQLRASQLRQAQKMETLGQLSGAIAHDFNNLLQAIHGYAELARAANPRNVELAADLEEIVRAADRASELTRQLLTFSQPARANARVVDVNLCVSQTVPMMRHLLGPTIQLSTVLRPEAGYILIDPTQLEQAIVNLCVNGRDAMPDGGSLTIETGRRSVAQGIPSNPSTLERSSWTPRPVPAQALTFVDVCDTGVGIAPEIRDRIFEPFFTTKDIGKGTGLGLAIVYGIVRNASGDILVDSEPGHGTRFSLVFPACGSPQEASAAGGEPPIHGTETVLLVEDEQAIRKLTERVLAGRGYRVLSAASAAEARELWSEHAGDIDLLLSDVTMPGESGVALAAELEASSRPPRVLFISGHISGEAGGAAFPEGARLLGKPFSVAALLEAVRETLDAPTVAGDVDSGA